MDRYEHTVMGLWVFAVAYVVHWILYPLWTNRSLLKWLNIPLGIIAWAGVVGLLMPFKDFAVVVVMFFEHPTMGTTFEVGMFAVLFTGMAWLYQNSDVARFDRLRPFLRESLFFRHSGRTRHDVFAGAEQRAIDDLAVNDAERKALREVLHKKRLSPDRELVRKELELIRRQKEEAVGREEAKQLERGLAADITDVCRRYHMDQSPHTWVGQTFRLSIDPDAERCNASIVLEGPDRERIKEPKRWFRFEQNMFDYAQTLYSEGWMARFRPFFTTIAVVCHAEETDSFGLPKRAAFLSVEIPTDVLDRYKGRMFIATDLESVATITWLENPG